MQTKSQILHYVVLLARTAFIGTIIGSMSVVIAISFASIVFTGPLLPFLSEGIGLVLLSAVVLTTVGAYRVSYTGTICQPQDITAVILSISAASIATTGVFATPENLFATIVMLCFVTTFSIGLAFWLLGRFELGYLVRYIPYPVLGGFLVATGYILILSAFSTMTGSSAELHGIVTTLSTISPALWLPWVFVAFGMVIAGRSIDSGLVIPVCIVVAFAGFYLSLMVFGLDLAGAQQLGMLLGPFEGNGFFGGLSSSLVFDADYPLIFEQLPTIATLVCLSIVGIALNASALELVTREEISLNKDLVGVGLANMAASFAGGLAGYHIVGETILAWKMGLRNRLAGLSAGVVCLAALVFGASFLSVLPTGVFGAIIAYLGLDVLYQWLWVERRKLPLQDFAIVLLILGVAASVGFVEAVATGILATSLRFVATYSRIDVIRNRQSGRYRRSNVERSESESELLASHGEQTLIYEFGGYIFFGTANLLYTSIRAELREADENLRYVIIDLHRVQGLDISAVHSFAKLAAEAENLDLKLLLTGMLPAVDTKLRDGGAFALIDTVAVYASTSAALSWVENRILQTVEQTADDQARKDWVSQFETSGKSAVLRLSAGESLMKQDEAENGIYVLKSGILSALVDDGSRKKLSVATFHPGALVGELSAVTGMPRSATIIAETEAEVLHLSGESLNALRRDNPSFAEEFTRHIAATVARRLVRTTHALHEAQT